MLVNVVLDTKDPLDHYRLSMLLSVTVPTLEEAPEAPEAPAKKEKKPSKTPVEKAKSKEPATPEPEVPSVSMKDVLSKAVTLLDNHGEQALASILRKLGIARVKECPADKLADLLTEIATYE